MQGTDHAERDAAAEAPSTATSVKQHCLQILTSGCPQAFAEFFELTHTAVMEETSEGNRGRLEEAELQPTISLDLLRNRLVAAEEATGSGDMGSVYVAYRELAEHFASSEQQEPAIKYYGKCLEIAKHADDRSLQLEAYERLGCAHERHADLLQAVAFFERQAGLSQSAEDIQRATAHLRQVYWMRAEQLEKEKNYRGALSDFQRVAQAASVLGDARSEGQACYRLGLLHTTLSDPTPAVTQLQKYKDICRADGDRVGEGQACCALAEAYQALGDTTKALGHLEAFLTVEKYAQPALQARAYCSLGLITGQQEGLQQRSLACFERFFALASSTGDRAMLDAARTHLGRARALAQMGNYMDVVDRSESDAHTLLSWKQNRLPLQTSQPS